MSYLHGATGRRTRCRGGRLPLRYGLTNAADLAEASYDIRRQTRIQAHLVESIDEEDVQAHLLDNGLLLIPGSNSLDDYVRYNFGLVVGGKRYTVKESATGSALGGRWHQGFLAHAMVIHKRLNQRRPKFIIGHSLGAAAAQFLSLLWRVPAIGFAAPRLHAGGREVNNDRLCLCLWRKDDPVGSFPGDTFRHVGKSIRLDKNRSTGLLNHSLRHYKASMANTHNRAIVPKVWPAT